jgi:hypothetical protein
MQSAREFWTRANRRNFESGKQEGRKAATEVKITNSERDAVLKLNGFGDLQADDEKAYIFTRIGDLKHKLEDEEGRTIAQRAIRLELRMRRNDAIVSKIEAQAANPATDAKDALALRGDIKGYNDIGKELHTQHLELMEAMNATQAQNPSVAKKVAFVDCLGQLMRGVQEYEARGDTAIIDGIFTASEVKIQVAPMSLRPPQYRLDIVMIIHEAMKHENLWNPDYEPPSIERTMYRRMRKALSDTLNAAANEDGTVIEMEDEESVESRGSNVESMAAPVAPASAAPVTSGMAPPPMLPNSRANRPGEEIVVG